MSVSLTPLSEHVEKGIIFWDNDENEIETVPGDGLDAAGYLFRYAKNAPKRPENRKDERSVDMNNLQVYCRGILKKYVDARTQFLREELAKARAKCPHSKGDILYLNERRVMEDWGESMVLDNVAGFLTETAVGYVLIGRLNKPDGKPGKVTIVAFESDFVTKGTKRQAKAC